jgi:uncharacterized protein (DUF433 family)
MSGLKLSRAERDAAILEHRRRGETLSDIAETFGLTRERVRQIINDLRGTTADESRKIRKQQKNKNKNNEIKKCLSTIGKAKINHFTEHGVGIKAAIHELSETYPEFSAPTIRAALHQSGAIFDSTAHVHPYTAQEIELGYLMLYARYLHLDYDEAEVRRHIDPHDEEVLHHACCDENLSDKTMREILSDIASARIARETGTCTGINHTQYDLERREFLTEHHIASARGKMPWPVTSQTMMKRAGKGYWGDAVTALGFSVSSRGRVRGNLIYSDNAYIDALADFAASLEETGEPMLTRLYEEWVKTEEAAGRRRPSTAAVREQFGSWNAAKRALFAAHPSK